MPFVGDSISHRSNHQKRKRTSKDDDGFKTPSRLSPEAHQQTSSFFTPLPSKSASAKRARNTAAEAKIAAEAESDNEFSVVKGNPSGNASSTSGAGVRVDKALLTPCHICYRRPVRKHELDLFAPCQRCGKKACHVCLRQCLGLNTQNEENDDPTASSKSDLLAHDYGPDRDDKYNGAQQRTQKGRDDTQQDADEMDWAVTEHRAVICSRCCVESGPEGEIICFGCLCGAKV